MHVLMVTGFIGRRRESLCRSCRLGQVCLALVAAGVLSGWTPGGAMAAGGPCQGADVPVSALAGAHMHGTLCLPPSGQASTVIVLVPGATYNHTYWDFPYEPQTYNFRQAMNEAGYATFVVDRLGTGLSSRPLSALVTASVQADAVHNAISELRHGRIGGITFAKVILGGHSLGSAIAIMEAATFDDENAVLLTGLSHQPTTVTGFASILENSFYPADLDANFAGKGYDPGYLTTRPGTRQADFYAASTTDPNVVAEDEATKDVFSTAEAPDAFTFGALGPYSDLIKRPVLIADGAQDQIVCDAVTNSCGSAAALKASEAPYYTGSPCLETYLLAGSGHDINLATDTHEYQDEVRSWAGAFVGTGPDPVTPSSCGD